MTLNDPSAVQALCTDRIADILDAKIMDWIEADGGHWQEDPNAPSVYGYWSAEHGRIVVVLYARAGDVEVDGVLLNL